MQVAERTSSSAASAKVVYKWMGAMHIQPSR